MSTRKIAFVLMPFADSFREVYSEVYKPTCEANDLDCWRVDELARPGSITRDIVEGILDADLIIADLTSRNPNVFYELGIAHTIDNKTIMTAQALTDVPFDLQSYRVILYEQSIAGSKKLSSDLDTAIKELLQALDRTNNPVQDAASRRAAFGRKGKTPLIKAIELSDFTKAVQDFLREKGIMSVEDLPRIDLEAMYATPGIGKDSIAKFVSELLHSDLYPDGQQLQDFVLRHRLRINRFRRW